MHPAEPQQFDQNEGLGVKELAQFVSVRVLRPHFGAWFPRCRASVPANPARSNVEAHARSLPRARGESHGAGGSGGLLVHHHCALGGE